MKLGLTLMVVSLLLTTGWIRSLGREDNVHFCPGRTLFCVGSQKGEIHVLVNTYHTHEVAASKSLAIFRSPLRQFNTGWLSGEIGSGSNVTNVWQGSITEWHWQSGQFTIGRCNHTTPSDEHKMTFLIMPYWSLVWPMGLLSMFLLLFQMRKVSRAIVKSADQTANDEERG